jgi:hypothetical protein
MIQPTSNPSTPPAAMSGTTAAGLVCTYSAISGSSSRSVKVYQGRSRYEVLETRTGRRVSTITVDVDLEPTDAQLEAAVGSLVNGTASD